MYVPWDGFAEVFRREMEEWVLPASGRSPGRKGPPVNPERPDQANELVGLALSGGGIRSATFALGACQAMARYGMLERVDYLSTVSGGGYLGSSISSLLHHGGPPPTPHPLSSDSFPFRFDPTAPSPEKIPVFKAERRTVRHLREHSNFLAPRLGLFDVQTWNTILQVLLRLVATLLLIALPPVVLLLAGLTFVPDGWWHRDNPLKPWGAIGVPGALGGAALLVYLMLLMPPFLRRRERPLTATARVQRFCIFVILGAAAAIGFLFGVQATNAAFQAKATAWNALIGAFGGGASALLLMARWAFARLGEIDKAQESKRGAGRERATGLLLQVLFNILGFVVLVLGVLLGFVLLDGATSGVRLALLIVAAIITITWVLLDKLVDVLNSLSLHTIYRQRLSEAYVLRETPPTGRGAETEVEGDADVRLSGLQAKRRETGAPLGPLHIIGTSLNISGSSDIKQLGRRSDSFFFSCLYSGSPDTGFVATSRGYPRLSLATAMAISGAAFSPNQGSFTTSSTAILMTLLNARLGFWVRNPRLHASSPRERPSPLPIRWLYYLAEMFGAASGRHRFVYLTDGGHFDNSGIYELIRRRCRYIIAVDGAGEPSPTEPEFGTLGTVVRLARIDFGVDIELDLAPLMPDPDTGRTPTHFAVGRIVYPRVTRPGRTKEQEEADRYGTIVYLKATLSRQIREPDLEFYRRRNPLFPNHSTLDQFFDEAQFEAYRALGYRIARDVFKGVAVKEDGTRVDDAAAFTCLAQPAAKQVAP